MQRIWTTLLVMFVIALLAGCSILDNGESEVQITQTATVPAPAPSPTPQSTPLATESAGLSQPTTLSVWVIDVMSPNADTLGGSILAEQLTAFETNHPDITVNVEVKSPRGKGGTLSYLRSGRHVAPAILPATAVR